MLKNQIVTGEEIQSDFEENKYYGSNYDGIIYILKIIKGVALSLKYSQHHNIWNMCSFLITDLKEWGYKEIEEEYLLDDITVEELLRL